MHCASSCGCRRLQQPRLALSRRQLYWLPADCNFRPASCKERSGSGVAGAAVVLVRAIIMPMTALISRAQSIDKSSRQSENALLHCRWLPCKSRASVRRRLLLWSRYCICFGDFRTNERRGAAVARHWLSLFSVLRSLFVICCSSISQ